VKLGRVIGQVVATSKHAALEGHKILMVAPLPGSGSEAVVQLAVDGVGAGIGSEVIVTESGAAGALVTGLEFPPLRSVIVGIVDRA
jgi:ethanolamine utilization protein EutN